MSGLDAAFNFEYS